MNKNLFDSLLFRFCVVVVLFNFLVIFFKLNDLDNDHVIAWHLLEPFWLIEVFLFKAALFIIAGYLIFLAIQHLYSCFKRLIANYDNKLSEKIEIENKPVINLTPYQESTLAKFRKDCAQEAIDIASGKKRFPEKAYQDSVERLKESSRYIITSVQELKPQIKILKSSSEIKRDVLRSLTGGNSNE